jgi:hypothetical protein
MASVKKYSFSAKIERGPGGGAFVRFPHSVENEFGIKGRVPVNVLFDGFSYTGSLMPSGRQQHVLGILKAIREQAGKHLGDTISVQLWRDQSDRTVEVPSDLAGLMKKHGIRDFFDALSFTNRREYCRWITEAKKEETRAARLDKSIDLMRRGIRTPG